MFTTIQGHRHTIRRAYGDSDKAVSGQSSVTPLHGVGQDNGAGPGIWAVVSSPVLEVLRAEVVECFFF